MNILILKPGNYFFDYTYYASDLRFPIWQGWEKEVDRQSIPRILEKILERCREKTLYNAPDAIAIYGNYGGEQFPAQSLVDENTVERLEPLIPSAPMHIPMMIATIKALETLAPEIPKLVLFGTSFFADLPKREILYGLDPGLMKNHNIRRFGYHGLFHEACAKKILRKLKKKSPGKTPRIISLCLNPRPELAAILGNKPRMVTSGATPLEGLPGHTGCGEIDPAIVLLLSQKHGWGPEQINKVLTRESGLFALAYPSASIGKIFQPGKQDCKLARQVLQYRILLSCGAALSTLGGLDAIIFSGQFAKAGVPFVKWLFKRKFFQRLNRKNPIEVDFLEDSLEQIISEKVSAAVIEYEWEKEAVS